MKCITINDRERLYLADHGDLGIAIIRAEKRGNGRYKTIEETLVPRALIGAVARMMLNMSLDIGAGISTGGTGGLGDDHGSTH